MAKSSCVIYGLVCNKSIEGAIRKVKAQEKAKELQDKVYAKMLADIEANEKDE